MDITDIRVKLMEDRASKLQAFCSITINNGFVVRDIRVIEGTRGSFIAMPSRKLTDRCPRCGFKNHLRAEFCNDCGNRLPPDRAERDSNGRARLHADVAHPIHSACREQVQSAILEAFRREQDLSRQEGYVPREIYEEDELPPELLDDRDRDSSARAPEGGGASPDPSGPSGGPERAGPARDGARGRGRARGGRGRSGGRGREDGPPRAARPPWTAPREGPAPRPAPIEAPRSPVPPRGNVAPAAPPPPP
ncbi:MAG: septation protein SpoVG family protein, partial [Planctomycetes bacterium]|nr:septation protein SpoVG family protein [Planctomycetota bacterium]